MESVVQHYTTGCPSISQERSCPGFCCEEPSSHDCKDVEGSLFKVDWKKVLCPAQVMEATTYGLEVLYGNGLSLCPSNRGDKFVADVTMSGKKVWCGLLNTSTFSLVLPTSCTAHPNDLTIRLAPVCQTDAPIPNLLASLKEIGKSIAAELPPPSKAAGERYSSGGYHRVSSRERGRHRRGSRDRSRERRMGSRERDLLDGKSKDGQPKYPAKLVGHLKGKKRPHN